MDWLDFTSSLVGSLAWPFVVVVAIILLRRPLQELLPMLRNLRYRDFELNFGQKIQELEQRAEEEELPRAVEPSGSAADSDAEAFWRLNVIASASPSAAVLVSWMEVEQELQRVAERFDVRPSERSTGRLVKILSDQGQISTGLASLINELRQVRNRVAHGRDDVINMESALRIAGMSQGVIVVLKGQAPG